MRWGWLSCSIVTACMVGEAPEPSNKLTLPDANLNVPDGHVFCVDVTNSYRALVGKPAVSRSSELEAFADTGAMVDFGSYPHAHFIETNGGGIAFAENECPKWSLENQPGGDLNALISACLDAFYSEGPGTGADHGHYNNLTGDHGTVGCGIYESGGLVTLVQDFGN